MLEAFNGFDGLERAAAQLPDLILLDVKIPELDRFDILQRLKANAKTRGIPVIMLTAEAHINSIPMSTLAPYICRYI